MPIGALGSEHILALLHHFVSLINFPTGVVKKSALLVKVTWSNKSVDEYQQ